MSHFIILKSRIRLSEGIGELRNNGDVFTNAQWINRKLIAKWQLIIVLPFTVKLSEAFWLIPLSYDLLQETNQVFLSLSREGKRETEPSSQFSQSTVILRVSIFARVVSENIQDKKYIYRKGVFHPHLI